MIKHPAACAQDKFVKNFTYSYVVKDLRIKPAVRKISLKKFRFQRNL